MFTTDKIGHGYLPVYMFLLAPLNVRHAGVPRIVEIGVANGEGLDMLRTLAPGAEITGVDINPAARWPEDCHRVICSQDAPELVDKLPGLYDLIIDDASHNNAKTTQTLINLWPKVVHGGHYVIEDWTHAGGICQDLAADILTWFRHPLLAPQLDQVTYRDGLIIMRRSFYQLTE